MNIDYKGEDILILGQGPPRGIDDTTLTAEVKYPINFTQPRKKIYISSTL